MFRRKLLVLEFLTGDVLKNGSIAISHKQTTPRNDRYSTSSSSTSSSFSVEGSSSHSSRGVLTLAKIFGNLKTLYQKLHQSMTYESFANLNKFS
ncbi:hypothetical protein EUGRSUZ_B01046 [Eucalyptus grandis]|uniref:Uncharacterized protein n=2 Tax=Eucalyptus grandis TaxID=71139 RepID=A0ACC3LPG8_EUCGR|nr:hypothetical protein EUGRSUZ_B01046 [Eucalyptus grandis]